MNPDDDDAVINQLKHPRISLDILPKVGLDFIKALESRKSQQDNKTNINLQMFAEDELIRKEYKELRCEMPGTPRSTFLMVFSPDGTKVASTHGNHNIYITDLKSGKNIRTLIGHPRTPWCIAFHPTCNELVASGCLGGQVRIWDLSGGSEVWTAGSQTVIASIAFHPNDRILVIATYNELHFWDWSKPQPFKCATTCNTKEKVRYVAFDKLGHKLITGIANTPQSRWERSKANTSQNRWERAQTAVPVPDRSISPCPYRRRITPRLVANYASWTPQPVSISSNITSNSSDRVPLSSVPERERRITACYRNLVHEYELLVHRYLQVYRPPTTIDRGTDPMDTESQTDSQSPGPSTSGHQRSSSVGATTSTTNVDQQHSTNNTTERNASCEDVSPSTSNNNRTQPESVGYETSPRRRLVMRTTLGVQTSTDSSAEPATSGSVKTGGNKGNFKMRIKCLPRRRSNSNTACTEVDNSLRNLNTKLSQIQKNLTQNYNDQIINIVPKIPDFRNRNNESQPSGTSNDPTSSEINTPSTSELPTTSRNMSLSPTEPTSWNSLKEPQNRNKSPWRLPVKRLYPGFIKKAAKHTRKPVIDTSSDNSTSDEDDVAKKRLYCSTPSGNNSNSSNISLNNNSNLPGPSTSTEPNPPPVQNVCSHRNVTSHSTRSSLDRLVSLTDLVANNGDIERSTTGIMCDRCGGNIDMTSEQTSRLLPKPLKPPKPETSTTSVNVTSADTNLTTLASNSQSSNGCASVERADVTQPCARTLLNTDTRTTNSTVYTPSSGPRRRFFSHMLSAFLPTRPPQVRSRRSSSYIPQSNARSALNSITRGSNIYSLVPDEVINYSERVNSEEDYLTEQSASLNEFHPFDPPPEFPSINPENIGIGNMYSNIVQDLESSLSNVRDIWTSNRPGETSDMLSSFTERLESIMHQSDSILRNLRHTMDLLPTSEQSESVRTPIRASPTLNPSPRNTESDHPRFIFNDPNFYVRDHSQSGSSERNNNTARLDTSDTFSSINQHEDLDSNRRNAIASDHTYPRNPENPRILSSPSDNLTPLMTSLHLTISHIQRQARLLRLQVESIERIDRAMLEVAQLQMIRQMFGEIRRHLTNLGGNDNRNAAVSSVRQMMAGTRISDSSPCDSPAEDETVQNRSEQNAPAAVGEVSENTQSSSSNSSPSTSNLQSSRSRVTARKSFLPSRLLHIQRQNRRFSIVNFVPRRYSARDRLARRKVYFRTFAVRPNPIRLSGDMSGRFSETNRIYGNNAHVNSDTLLAMTRRLEVLLTEHIRLIGRPAEFHSRDANTNINDGREDAVIERLNVCRTRINRIMGRNGNVNNNLEIGSVTLDGISRFNARDTLSMILDVLTRFFDESVSTVTQSLRSQIRSVIDLTSLLSDILLLHIVDSIPPPTGMNLDPERESLSTRIDHMCTRMLHSRFGQSHNLARSLRLMRLTARYASRALGQTYNIRRNAIFSNGNSSRRELLGQINNTLHSIHRNRSVTHTPFDMPSSSDSFSHEMPFREWYRTINALVSRYSSSHQQDSNSSTVSNSSNTSNSRHRDAPRSSTLSEDVNISDDNDDYEPDWFNNNIPNERRQSLYRTSNVNLLNNEDSTPSAPQPSRAWNVPSVHINDIPISENNSAWHSRITSQRYRLSELRSNPSGGLFRPRFLHPLYAGVNPFDADLDDPQREQIYDGDMILTVTPNHRIQAWDISSGHIPDISNSMKNLVVAECKIHNDASVDISSDGTILVTLLPSGGYLNVTNRLGVYSLRWETLGQCLYQTSFEQNAVSVSLSPLSRHLVVGLASRRVSIVPNDKWTMARIFLLNQNELPYGSRLPVLRELEQNRDTSYMSLNCIRWLPASGQGLIYATNTGQLRILT